jgi:molybdopterin-guanine dinucleotide biosynthesis protein A
VSGARERQDAAIASGGVLGVISAGGVSRRYGSPKALAPVAGMRVIDRVGAAVAAAVGSENVVAIINDSELAARVGLPHRPDVLRDIGALAGVHTALLWARERDCRGALVLGCDMPLVTGALLRALVARSGDADLVIPESTGPRGVEPLCAFYGAACLPAIEAAIAAGDLRMIGFHDAVRVVRLPLAEVRRFGEPERIFMNLNTPAEREQAEKWVAGDEER